MKQLLKNIGCFLVEIIGRIFMVLLSVAVFCAFVWVVIFAYNTYEDTTCYASRDNQVICVTHKQKQKQQHHPQLIIMPGSNSSK